MASHDNSTTDAPIASTATGKVRGYLDNGVSVFKAIPYGGDTATRRFRAPAAPAPWAGVRDALEYGFQSPQTRSPSSALFKSWRENDQPSSEDCLVLNVWTPALRDGAKRPVMVWFHGGGFSNYSGSALGYDGVRLARRGDVVVVTVNHRLTVFGYLYLAGLAGSDFADSGNAGMLDLIQSLEWVRDNIAEFGGDPDNVMIFGESGGGAKVSTLMAMPRAKGLFHKAAVQSGALLSGIPIARANEMARTYLDALDLAPEQASAIVDLPLERLLGALKSTGAGMRGPMNFTPVVDGGLLARHPFAPDAPEISANVPLLIGTTRDEMTLLSGDVDPSLFTLTWEELPARLSRRLPRMNVPKMIAEYRRLYPEGGPGDIFFAVETAAWMLNHATQQAERKAAQGAAPVFMYQLDWPTPVDGGKWKAPHALCIAFAFDNVEKSESMCGLGLGQQRMADQMSEAWIAFARSGDPNTPILPPWPAYDAESRATMVFDLESKVVPDLRRDERLMFLPSSEFRAA